ncbi:RloB family protein [Chitinophaga silvisoli]|uniref:RloB domain-containing protein n=1 Tax=Chitinophaga silvisoli TaxID=2291814 RepID=A0A3E1P9Q1_9BACT|nr:RloB family protein [Chitinophaga silvisoli]RFM36903.1 RloB domain-containing protein [Chitinophaga silvisoli]
MAIRAYKKGAKHKSCTLFFISTEGGKREPGYFSPFDLASPKVKVEIVGDYVWNAAMKKKFETKSSPEWVLSRTKKFIKENNILSTDHLHFIIDVDQWSPRQIKTIVNFCRKNRNWDIALSNPCFEVFLILGILKEIPFPFDETDRKSKKLKSKLAELDPGGYYRYDYIRRVRTCIENAKRLDQHHKGIIPAPHTTQVYKTLEKLISFIGINHFTHFIDTIIPKLIADDKKRAREKYKKEGISS